MNPRNYLAIAVVAFVLAAPTSARADAVGDWNAITVQATVTAARPGPTGVFDIATVQAAVYDAVQAIEGQYRPYSVDLPGAIGSPVAAAATAAHHVLVNRFPAQTATLDATYQQYLSDEGVSMADPGIAVGAAAAAGIIALRTGDGSFPVPAPPPFTGGTGVGVWRPTPPANLPMLAPWMAAVRPFTLLNASQFRANPPPALSSPEYAANYREIKRLGALNSSTRTADQTDLGHFWNLNYIVVWNVVLRDLAAAHVGSISDSSRLFALASMAMADSIITAWQDKTRYVSWRPITAIREGENDGNPRTLGDESWTPLITTPPYPDHTSGANNVSAAATKAFSLFFGMNDMTFDITTTNTGPTLEDTRTYHKFSDVRHDVVEARILEGIHFRFADAAGRRQGERVAYWAFSNFFRPIDE